MKLNIKLIILNEVKKMTEKELRELVNEYSRGYSIALVF